MGGGKTQYLYLEVEPVQEHLTRMQRTVKRLGYLLDDLARLRGQIPQFWQAPAAEDFYTRLRQWYGKLDPLQSDLLALLEQGLREIEEWVAAADHLDATSGGALGSGMKEDSLDQESWKVIHGGPSAEGGKRGSAEKPSPNTNKADPGVLRGPYGERSTSNGSRRRSGAGIAQEPSERTSPPGTAGASRGPHGNMMPPGSGNEPGRGVSDQAGGNPADVGSGPPSEGRVGLDGGQGQASMSPAEGTAPTSDGTSPVGHTGGGIGRENGGGGGGGGSAAAGPGGGGGPSPLGGEADTSPQFQSGGAGPPSLEEAAADVPVEPSAAAEVGPTAPESLEAPSQAGPEQSKVLWGIGLGAALLGASAFTGYRLWNRQTQQNLVEEGFDIQPALDSEADDDDFDDTFLGEAGDTTVALADVWLGEPPDPSWSVPQALQGPFRKENQP